nr:hypothetical protein [Baekduia sp.]
MSDDAGSMVAPTRVLSLDVPLHDPRVQRASFGSTRTLLEHEIVLWDPARMLDDYHGTSTFEGSRRLADNPSARYKRDA